jgi:hypothetical protein
MCCKENNWINVLEEYPEDATEVLVVWDKSVQFSVHFNGIEDYSHVWFSKDLQTYFENIEWWKRVPELPDEL